MLGTQLRAQEQGLIFYLPFEEGATAAVAGGAPEPLTAPVSKPGELVEGIKGKGMQFKGAEHTPDQQTLFYSFLGVPPSMLMICPVMNLDSSETRKSTRLATSSG